MPYPPRRVDILGNWLYDQSTLNVVGDGVTTHTGSELHGPAPAGRAHPGGPRRRGAGPAGDQRHVWTALPDDLPPSIAATAAEVAGTGTDLEQAGRLQTWFRGGGGFQYSLDAPTDSGSTGVADFLVTRQGYCVHFASAMAIMARTLDIPARVAVGFLPGEQQADGTWVITQQDAHAWPELYFEGAGWMRFEPTPSSRAGGLPSWAAPAVTAPTAAPSPAPSATAVMPTGAQEATAGRPEQRGAVLPRRDRLASGAAVAAAAALSRSSWRHWPRPPSRRPWSDDVGGRLHASRPPGPRRRGRR